MVSSSKATKKQAPQTKIDTEALEVFRQTLPDYRQQETMHLLTLQWDIVKALYLIAQTPHEVYPISVAKYAQVMGFPTREEYEQRDVTPIPFSLFYADPKCVTDERIDLERPMILAQVIFPGQVSVKNVLIDGLHRLYKASCLGVETLFIQQLSVEESRLCEK